MWGFLRLTLALTVVTFHSAFLSGVTSHAFTPGDMSVEMFFVISGFVITKSIRKNYATGWSGIGRFWQNRVLRLFPSYWCALSIGLLVAPASFHWHITMALPRGPEWISAVFIIGQTGLFSYRGGLGSDPLLATWSLTVELFYYHILTVWAARSRRSAIIFTILSIFVALFVGCRVSIDAMYFGVLWQCLPFAIGCLLASADISLRMKPSVAMLIVGASLLYVWLIPETQKTLYLCSLVAAAAIIACENVTQNWFDRFLAELSYPTYVIQFPVMALLRYLRGWDYVVASVVGALVAGLLIHLTVELPIRSFRTRIRLGRMANPVAEIISLEAQ